MVGEVQRRLRLGLIGYPLEHSLSPQLHSAALQAAGRQGEYRLYPLALADAALELPKLVERLRRGELDGLNVTIPYKQSLAALVDELTPAAARIRAVNTLYCTGGKVWGDNTDAPAFWQEFSALEASQPARMRSPAPVALVLGAGGAARAVVYALLQGGWQVRVAARRPAQAEELLAALGAPAPLEVCTLSAADLQRGAGGVQALVNTTPLGMHPQVQGCPWPEELALPAGAVVYDVIYNPSRTVLLQRACRQGLAQRGGLGMLVEQAALAFERWSGYRPERDLLFQAVAEQDL